MLDNPALECTFLLSCPRQSAGRFMRVDKGMQIRKHGDL